MDHILGCFILFNPYFASFKDGKTYGDMQTPHDWPLGNLLQTVRPDVHEAKGSDRCTTRSNAKKKLKNNCQGVTMPHTAWANCGLMSLAKIFSIVIYIVISIINHRTQPQPYLNWTLSNGGPILRFMKLYLYNTYILWMAWADHSYHSISETLLH